MSLYRKKPVVVEAIQLTDEISCAAIGGWMLAHGFTDFLVLDNKGTLRIRTLEGDHRADIGDFVIRGVAGEFYPCKPDIFEATYEPVD